MSQTLTFTIPPVRAGDWEQHQERVSGMLAEMFDDSARFSIEKEFRQMLAKLMNAKASTRVHLIIDEDDAILNARPIPSDLDEEQADWLQQSRRQLQRWMDENEY